jgi:MFS family permease
VVAGRGGRRTLAAATRHASAMRVALGAGLVATVLPQVADAPVAHLAHQLTVANYVVTTAVVFAFAVAGAIVAYHQPRNAIGWLLLGAGAFLAVNDLASDYSVLAYRIHHGGLPLGPLAVLAQPSWAPGIVCIAMSILLFPDGRLPAGRWRWGLWAFLALGALWLGGAFSIAINAIAGHTIHVNPGGDLAIIDNPTGGAAWWGYVQDAFFPALALSALLWLLRQVMIFRWARGEQRQRLKWLISGVAISVLTGTFSAVGGGGSWLGEVLNAVVSAGLAAFPISIGVGIMHYRLYEIDRLISRTLSYAILTALLAGTFIGLIALTTDTLALSGRVGVAASTLAAAALFNPLRIRVQRLVDRRFNRARYDADATVAAFSAALRDAVDLDTVRAELLAAVQRAVQPSSASIWIR